MTAAATNIRLDHLDARMRAVWLREQRLHLLAGALAFCRWAVPLFLVGVLIDWLTYMPAFERAVMLVALLGVSFFRAWRCGWRRLRPFNARQTALQLEAHHTELDTLLVSAIQFREAMSAGGGSASLREHICRQAEQAAANLSPEQAIPYRPLRQPGLVALLLAVVLGVFLVVNAAFLLAGLTRIFSPWVDVEYPTDTQIVLQQDELIVKEGDRASILASIGGEVPKQATIIVKTGEGREREIELSVSKDADTGEGTCEYTIASASRDFTYRIKAGDDRTKWQRVSVVPAPRIERLKVKLNYPEYLGRKAKTVEALTLTVPEGSKVGWRLTLDRPIRAAQFVRDGEEPVDLMVSKDGRVVSFTQSVSASQGYYFVWTGREHGFTYTSPRYYLQLAADQAPRVELIQPSSNLDAMIGRPLDLVVRLQDDHGIDTAKVMYRLNKRDDQAVEIDMPAQVGESGSGEQRVDWDYRAALPALKVGDSVSFMVQAQDRYPGEQGPHMVRSEARRITFLSKEQYLEKIAKRKDRQLSRVQTLYRQQRSAHAAVRSLDPKSEGYMQACQLEAIRQEMMRDQLNEIAGQLQRLIDDLAANGVSDAPEGESLEMVRDALRDIAESYVARGATLLREQSGLVGDGGQAVNPRGAAHAVNTAARGLGGLVLLRGIDSAQEVYAREARMLAREQALLRWHTATNTLPSRVEGLAAQQDELAVWTRQLIAELQDGMRYDKRPLAVLRLVRSIKGLDASQAEGRMQQAGGMIREGKAAEAAELQAGLVRDLLNAEFSVRLTGAYSTLLSTRRTLRGMADAQAALVDSGAELSGDALATELRKVTSQQKALRKQLLTLMLPTVPAPRGALFDEQMPKPPPVEALLAEVDRAMSGALGALAVNDRAEAAAQQRKAAEMLVRLSEIVEVWSVQMGLQTQGLGTIVAATSERQSRIKGFEDRLVALLLNTETALDEEKKIDGLAEDQLILAKEVRSFYQDLSDLQAIEPDADLPPLMARMDRVERALNVGAQPLQDNDGDAAIEYQSQAFESLVEAQEVLDAQYERLALLQSLLMFQRSVGFASGYMTDIVAEQRDLLAATEAVEPAGVPAMMPVFGHMRRCMQDVAPLLDLVGGRLDVGTPLAFARTDFAEAMDSLQAGDKLDSIDAQDVAAESLGEVRSRVVAIQVETGYVAEIVQYLHSATSEAVMLQTEQQALSRRIAEAKPGQSKPLIDAQAALLVRAERYGRQLDAATGMPEFNEPVQAMRAAIEQLKAGDAASAAEQAERASMSLTSNAEMLFAVITMLHGLPSIEITGATEPELVRLVDALALASEHQQLLRSTPAADPLSVAGLGQRQRELAKRCETLAQAGNPHPMLAAASKQLAQAASAFDSVEPVVIRRSQKRANAKLRHFIIEQALVLETAVPPPAPSDGDAPDGPGSDSEADVTAGFISDFVSGETPEDQASEWTVLGERNRAALNQNFARELPLEHRRLLKDYYERLAR